MAFQDDLQAAQQHLSAGFPARAVKAAKAAIRAQPKSPVAYTVMGIAHSQAGQQREAVVAFKKALELDPASRDARKNIGQALLLMDRADLALAPLEKLVRLAPLDHAAWYLLAQARDRSTGYVPAIEAASTAVDLAPRTTAPLKLRALIHLTNGRTADAIDDYQAALALDPLDVDTWVNLSLPLARHLRSADALQAAERAVALDPTHIPARLRLAEQLQATGQSGEAVAAYRQVLDKDPVQPDALSHLASLLPVDDSLALRPKAETALKAAPARSQLHAAAHFALATIARRAGDTDGWTRHLARANQDMAGLFAYDAKADTALTEAILRRFETELPLADAKDDTPMPIYVVGLPRSGTSLAEAMLGNHPEVAPLGERAEPGFLLKPVIDNDAPFDRAAIEAFRFEDARLMPRLPETTRAYVDKMPENYRLVGFLKAAYPGCRIVWLRRDPRDVALSMWQAHFSGTALAYTYDLRAMAHRFNLYGRMMAHWNRLLPGKILELRYEDLVEDPVAASRALANHCGLEWTAGMAQPHLTAQQILTISAQQVRQPVHRESVGRWQAHAEMLRPLIERLDPAIWPELAAD